MADKVLGIDFGSSGLKIAEVSTVKGSRTVHKQAFMPVHPSYIRHGRPVPEMAGQLAAELKSFLAEHKIGTKDTVLGIASVDDVYVNRASVPYHQPREFTQAVRYDIIADPSLLPGAPDDVLLDAVVFEDYTTDEGDRKLDALLIGVSPEVVNLEVDIAQKAGLNVAGADLSAFAALRSTRIPHRPAGTLDVLVDIGKDVFSVLIHENGKPFSLTLDSGPSGQDANNLISDAVLDDDQNRLDQEKVRYGTNHKVLQALTEYRFKVAAAIESTVTSYMALRRTSARVGGITLIGGGSLLHGLPEMLTDHLGGLPVVSGRYETGIHGNPQDFYAGPLLNNCNRAAVGLAMGATV